MIVSDFESLLVDISRPSLRFASVIKTLMSFYLSVINMCLVRSIKGQIFHNDFEYSKLIILKKMKLGDPKNLPTKELG